MNNNCIDCSKKLNKSHFALRCHTCANKLLFKTRNQFGNKNPNFRGGKLEINCDWCGKIVLRWKANKYPHTFCNEFCRSQWHRVNICGTKAANYVHGLGNENYSLEFSDLLKDKIRFRDNYKCQICNLKEKSHFIGNKKRKLIVHHIDYNKENCKENNLLTVCHDCHLQTNYNRDYWYAYCKYIMDNIICYTKS